MHLDLERISFDREELERSIAKEKADYRGIDWRLAKDPSYAMDRHRNRLKPAVTIIYALIAHSRGRVHRHDHDLESQEKWLEHKIKDYVFSEKRASSSVVEQAEPFGVYVVRWFKSILAHMSQ